MILGVEGLEGSVHNDYIDSSDLISRWVNIVILYEEDSQYYER